jgi:anti-sigma factor RsiW
MKTPSNFVSDGELQAYVDGLLAAGDRSRVESFLSSCPDERERLDAYRRQNVLLHRLYDWPAHRPLPKGHDVLVRRLSRKILVQRCMSGSLRAMAVVALAAVIGGVGFASYDWLVPDRAPLMAFSGQGADRYVMVVGDGQSAAGTDKSAEAIAKKSAEMLSSLPANRFGMPRQAPDFEKAGFRLIGVRTLSTPVGPAIQLVYGNGEDHRVTLFLRPNANQRAAAPSAADNGDVSMIYSEFDKMAYSLFGNVDRKTLLSLATLVSDTLATVRTGVPMLPRKEQSRSKAEPTVDSGPEAPARTNGGPPKRNRDLDTKGAVAPDVRDEQPPAVIKTGLKPPA